MRDYKDSSMSIKASGKKEMEVKTEQILSFYSLFLFFVFSGATPAAYGGSQARGLIRAIAAGLHHSHSHTRSELHLRPIPQLTATPDP